MKRNADLSGAWTDVTLFPSGDSPNNMAWDSDGYLYVTGAQSTDDLVWKVDVSDGSYSVFVTLGSGGLDDPEGLTFGPDGNLYVASTATDEILRYNGSTGAFMDVFVSAGSGGLSGPAYLEFVEVPEPAVTSALMLFGLTALIRRHRRVR